MIHVHISENDRGVPGRGHVPWTETFRAIKKSGYDGWLTIEAFGRACRSWPPRRGSGAIFPRGGGGGGDHEC